MISSLLVLMLCVSACSFEVQQRDIDQVATKTQAWLNTEPSRAIPSEAHTSVLRLKSMRVAGQSVRLDDQVLPSVFKQRVRYLSKGGATLAQVLADIAKLIDLPIKASEELAAITNRTDGLSTRMGNTTASAMGAVVGAEIDFEGSVQGLLEALASQNNLSWRFNAQSACVEFYRFETKAFSVSVPSGQKNINASISLSGVSEAAGASAALSSGGTAAAGAISESGAGNVSVNQSMNLNPWVSIMQGVRSILSDANQSLGSVSAPQGQSALSLQNGSNVSSGSQSQTMGNGSSFALGAQAIANPELGLITVTARPQSLERVQQYLHAINERYAKNVLIDVKIYSFSLDEQKSLGFGLNMIYTKLNQMNATIVSPQPLQAGVDTPGILTLGASSGSGAWSGSNVLAQALSQLGRVALLKQAQVLAINGQPSPVQVANEISFVASSATTLTPNVGAITTQTTGTKVVGFTANFLPLILGDGRILLSYQIQISSLASALTPNAQGIQTPNVATQSMQQQAFLNDGQSIVLFGFDEERNAQAKSLSVAGLSKSSSTNRDMVVIVLQVNTGAHRVTP